MMVPFVQIFGRLADLLGSGSSPLSRSGQYGKYDPNAAFDLLSFQARWQQYHVLLSEAFSDIFFQLGFAIGEAQDDSILKMDGIVRLMDQFIRTREISFHLTFATRIYMDVNFILGANASRGRRYLHETAQRMLETLEQRPSVEGPIPHKKWNAKDDAIVSSLLAEARWAATIDLRVLKSVPGLDGADWLLFDRHPVLCGLYVFRLQIIYQDTGLALANVFASIQSAAHLYQACKHSTQKYGREHVEWPDMELVMKLHGTKQTFGQTVPQTVAESIKAFQNIAGFTSHSRGGVCMVTAGLACGCSCKDGLEGLEPAGDQATIGDQTKILPMFKQRFTGNFNFAVQDDMGVIEALLRDLKASEAGDLASDTNQKPRRRGYRKAKKHRAAKFSITQLLSVLEKGLQMGTTSIRFDYVSMHLRCMRIFRDMKQLCDT